MMIAFSGASAVMSVRTSCFWFGSRPSVGSSRISTVGIVQQRLREADAALEALGQRLDRLLEHALERGALDRERDALLAPRRREAADARDEAQERRRASCRDRPARPRADSRYGAWPRSARSTMSAPQITAVPLRRREKAGDHLHRGRLAGAVRAEKAQHLAAPHRERNVVHRRHRAESVA